jgi:hypothetical protein
MALYDFDSWADATLADPEYSGYTRDELRSHWNKTYGPTEVPAAPKKTSLTSDSANLIGLGVDQMAAGLRWGVGKLSPGAAEGIDSAGAAMGMPTVDAVTKRHTDAISPETRAAMNKEFITEDDNKSGLDKYDFGPAWSDPRSYLAGVMQSLPGTALTMGPSMAIGKMVASRTMERALAAGATKEAAQAAANQAFERGAQVAGMVLEGGQQGLQSGNEIEEKVLKMPMETLRKSQVFQDLMATGLSEQEARKELASKASLRAAALAGVTTGIFGGIGDRVLAHAIGSGMTGGLGRRTLKTMAGESLEEAAQGVTQSPSENYALQMADPSIPLMQGAANNAVQGAVIGGLTGGPFGLVSKGTTPEAQKKEEELAQQAHDAVAGRGRAQAILATEAADQQLASAKLDAISKATSIEEVIAAATADLDMPAIYRSGNALPEGVDPLNGAAGAGTVSREAYPDLPGAPGFEGSQLGNEQQGGQVFLQQLNRISPAAADAVMAATARLTGAESLPAIGMELAQRYTDPTFWTQVMTAAGNQAPLVRTAAYQAMQRLSQQNPALQPIAIHIKDAASSVTGTGLAQGMQPLVQPATGGPTGSLADVNFRGEREAQAASSTLERGAQAVETPTGTRLQQPSQSADTQAVEALKASIAQPATAGAASAENAAPAPAIASLRAVSDAALPGIALARAFAQKLGRRVVVVDSDGEVAPFNGAVIDRAGGEGAGKGVLFLHAKTKRPATAVVGHELLHSLSQRAARAAALIKVLHADDRRGQDRRRR